MELHGDVGCPVSLLSYSLLEEKGIIRRAALLEEIKRLSIFRKYF